MKFRMEKFSSAVLVLGLLILITPSTVIVSASVTDYRTRSQIISDFLAFETSYPTLVDVETIGTSVEGRDIYLFKIGNSGGGIVFIDASIHGNEHSTTETLYWVVLWILTSEEESAQRIRQRNYVIFVPIVNVDGYGVSRYNAHGVDLNRNYETGWGKFNDARRGSYPLSEPETRAVHSVFLTYDVTWYLNLHTGDYRISPPWAYKEGVPEATVHKATYDEYYALSQERGVKAIPYKIVSNYAGGTARDEGYASGGAYTYLVELNSVLKPEYWTVTNVMVPKLITLTIVVCQECETKPPTEPEPEPEPQPEPPVISSPSPPDGATDIPILLSELSFNLEDPDEDLMDYHVTTDPDIGSGSAHDVSDGTYKVSVGNLDYKTTYAWQVDVTDGAHWNNKTYTFTTESEPEPEREMTAEDWQRFWEWLKQNPPSGWRRRDWSRFFDDRLKQYGSPSTVEDWESFWVWLKKHPPQRYSQSRWASLLEYRLEKWKSTLW